MQQVESPNATRDVAIGMRNLRAFVTLLVVFHHAVLLYSTSVPPLAASLTSVPLMWTAFPVIDQNRWSGFDLAVGYDDTFFMSLMFFLSGLFVWSSLGRKGAAAFLRDRARRLGIPFALSALVLAPLAYYPAFLQIGHASSGGGGGSYLAQWLSLPAWPAGPAWFLWVLLALGALSAALTAVAPRWGDALGRLAARAQRPVVFFALMLAVTALAYLPMARVIDPLRWVSAGPFWIQGSRALHYAAWFFAGVGVGAHGVERGLLARGGRLARRWWGWLAASLVLFVVEIAIVVTIFGALGKGQAPSAALLTSANVGFVVTCAAACLASLAISVRFARQSALAEALSRNAYGMYLTHYVFVSWLAYALLGAELSGIVKGGIVFVGAAMLSWGVAEGVRRRQVGRVVSDGPVPT